MHRRIRQRIVKRAHAVGPQPIAGQMLPTFGKVEQAQDGGGGGLALYRKDRGQPRVQNPCRMRTVQIGRGAAAGKDVADAKEGA